MSRTILFLHHLPAGFYVEDRALLIPWGTPRNQLAAALPPTHAQETADRWALGWMGVSFLDGLDWPLSAVFWKDGRPDAWRWVTAEGPTGDHPTVAESPFGATADRMTALCGAPTEVAPRGRRLWARAFPDRLDAPGGGVPGRQGEQELGGVRDAGGT